MAGSFAAHRREGAWLFASLAIGLGILALATLAPDAEATHFRGGTMYATTPDAVNDPYTARIHAIISIRNSYAGGPSVPGVVSPAVSLGNICFGDGLCTSSYVARAVTVDHVNDWATYEVWDTGATVPGLLHTYSSAGPWTYSLQTSCCRMSYGPTQFAGSSPGSTWHYNNPDTSHRLEGRVTLPTQQPYKADLPNVVHCPVTGCSIPLPASGGSTVQYTVRFASGTETGSYFWYQPGPCSGCGSPSTTAWITNAPPTWNWIPGAGAANAPSPDRPYYSTSVQLLGTGTDKSPLEFLVSLNDPLGPPPVSCPAPTTGQLPTCSLPPPPPPPPPPQLPPPQPSVLPCVTGPANDCFANAMPLTASFTWADNLAASVETGEPLPCGDIGSTVWFDWTPTTSGIAFVSVRGETLSPLPGVATIQVPFDSVVAVHTGSSLSTLTLVDCNDNSPYGGGPGPTGSYVQFTCVAGQTYRIQAGGHLWTQGHFRLIVTGCGTYANGPPAAQPPPSILPCPPLAPANDCFANAASISSPSTVTQLTLLASREPGEPAPCAGIGSTVWFEFTAQYPGFGAVYVDSSYSAAGLAQYHPAAVAVYTGSSLNSLTPVTCSAGSISGLASAYFSCKPGTTYRIQVGGVAGVQGRVSVSLTGCDTPPAPSPYPCNYHFRSNCFADAQTIESPFHEERSGWSFNLEAGEQRPCGGIGATSWYAWTAEWSGTAIVRTHGSSFDTVVAAYEATASPASLGSLALAMCNDDAGGALQSEVTFTCEAGKTYYLQVGGFMGSMGSSLVLDVAGCLRPPPAVHVHGITFSQVGSALHADVTVFDELETASFNATVTVEFCRDADCVDRTAATDATGRARFTMPGGALPGTYTLCVAGIGADRPWDQSADHAAAGRCASWTI